MSKKNAKELNLRAEPPKPSQLNRKLIVVVGGLVLLIIIFAFISSINSGTTQRAQDVESALRAMGNPDFNRKEELSSYSESKEIRKRLGMDKPPEVVTQTDPQLEAKLKQQQDALKRLQDQIAQLDRQPASVPEPAKRTLSPADQQALNAPIFFGGGAPKPPPEPKQVEAARQAAAGGKAGDSIESQRQSFMEGGDTAKDITNQNTIQKPIAQTVIMAGTTIPAILQTKIVSNLPGTIVARVSSDVYDSLSGHTLLIPRGSSLIGQYNSQTVYGDSSIQVKFIRLIRPDGSSIILPNQPGTDADGVSGLSDQLDNHWGQLIGASALATVFNIPAVASEVVQQSNSTVCTRNDDGTQNCYPNYGQYATSSALQSIGQMTSQVGGKLIDRSMDIKPTITINTGKRFAIMVTKDTYLPAYNK